MGRRALCCCVCCLLLLLLACYPAPPLAVETAFSRCPQPLPPCGSTLLPTGAECAEATLSHGDGCKYCGKNVTKR